MDSSLASSETQTKVLQAFSRTLGREAHVLTQHPDLLWQQIYNRLQWEDGIKPTLLTASNLWEKSSSPAWIRLDTRFRESTALVRTLAGHTDCVNACDFSPDGYLIASVSTDGTLRLWETNSAQQVLVLPLGIGWLDGCTFSKDGSQVFVASSDGDLITVDINTGQLVASHNLDCRLQRSRFSPGGQFLVSPVGDHSFHTWETSTGRLLGIPKGHAGRVSACSFSPDLQQLLTSSMDGTCRVWEIATSRLLQVFLDADQGIQACAYAPDGNSILTISYKNQVSIWERATGRLLSTLDGTIDGVNLCSYSPDGRWIAAAQREEFLKVWETASGRMVLLLEGHAGSIRSFSFSPDGRQVLTAGHDSTLRIWDLSPGNVLPQPEHHKGRIKDCTFSPDGNRVLSAGEDSTLRLWQAADGKPILVLKAHYNEVTACSFSPDGRKIFSSGWDGTLKIWDVASGQVLLSLGKSGFGLHSFSLSPDGGLVALFPSSKNTSEEEEEPETFQLWDANIGQLRFILEGHTSNYSVRDYCFSPAGDQLLSASQDGSLRTWDVNTGQVMHVFEIPDANVHSCAFSPDGQRFASASDDGTLRIWDALLGTELFCLQVQTRNHPGSCFFSPDGRFLVSHRGSFLDVWQAATAELQCTLPGHNLEITCVGFTPDGCFLVSAGKDRTVHFWNSETGREAASLPLPVALESLGIHPWQARFVLGDNGGNIHLADIQKLDFGPILVTSSARVSGMLIHCPACQTHHPITQPQLGSELTCPTPGCGLRLKINPFVIQMA